jgi:hypothetical protein
MYSHNFFAGDKQIQIVDFSRPEMGEVAPRWTLTRLPLSFLRSWSFPHQFREAMRKECPTMPCTPEFVCWIIKIGRSTPIVLNPFAELLTAAPARQFRLVLTSALHTS